jgi:hypothetical protein
MKRRRINDRIVVGVISEAEDYVVAIPLGRARDLASIHDAIRNSSTWGQFRAALPVADRRELDDVMSEGDPVDDGAPFDCMAVPGFGDGDWPEWPRASMLRWFPQDLLESVGEEETSVLNGDFAMIDARQLDAVIDGLRAAGYDGVLMIDSSLARRGTVDRHGP